MAFPGMCVDYSPAILFSHGRRGPKVSRTVCGRQKVRETVGVLLEVHEALLLSIKMSEKHIQSPSNRSVAVDVPKAENQ